MSLSEFKNEMSARFDRLDDKIDRKFDSVNSLFLEQSKAIQANATQISNNTKSLNDAHSKIRIIPGRMLKYTSIVVGLFATFITIISVVTSSSKPKNTQNKQKSQQTLQKTGIKA